VTDDAQIRQQYDSQRQKVDVDHYDMTVRELVRMSSTGELRRAPVYQRKFRWTEEAESRLIESLLLGLPVPSIFVATNVDGSWEVVDGLQRVSTLIHFVADPAILLESIRKSTPLTLTKLRKLPALNGLSLSSMPTPLQLQFYKRALRVTALSDKSDREARFDMFERLNTGGVELSPQEVRACIYQGPFNDMIRNLASYEPFVKLVKLQKKKQDDGTREELVLKFSAYLDNRSNFKGKVTAFLNEYMANASETVDMKSRHDLFTKVVDTLSAICRGPLLRDGVNLTPQNQLEAVMVAAADLLEAGDEIQTPPDGWLEDEELVDSSTGATNTSAMLNRRIKRATDLLRG